MSCGGGRTTCACVALKVPDDDDGMDLLLRLRGDFFSPSVTDDRATIPRWMGNRRLLSQGRGIRGWKKEKVREGGSKGDLANQ